MSILKVSKLKVAYGENVILDDISFSIAAGERIFIVGGSGSGKSTLMRAIIGLAPVVSGKIELDGMDTGSAALSELQALYRRVGVLFQSGALFASMNLGENVALPLVDFAGLSEKTALEVAKMKLSLVGLAGYENHLPAEISGGMQKRAGLARALALDPFILFLDEPSAGLDPITSAELDRLIIELNEGLGTTMVVVSHELASIFAVGQRVLMLGKDRAGLLASGTPKEMETSEDQMVKNFFQRRLSHGEGYAGKAG